MLCIKVSITGFKIVKMQFVDNAKTKVSKLQGAEKLIVDRLIQTKDEFYQDDKRKRRTTLIMKTLTLLGDEEVAGKPSYKVYSHSLPEFMRQSHGGKFKNQEFLYDLHWYTESSEDKFLPFSTPLVVECEWNPKKKGVKGIPFSGIKYDFQKLLMANADLRLMIFKLKTDRKLNLLNLYFENAISAYRSLPLGSKFLFVAYIENRKGFYYYSLQKK